MFEAVDCHAVPLRFVTRFWKGHPKGLDPSRRRLIEADICSVFLFLTTLAASQEFMTMSQLSGRDVEVSFILIWVFLICQETFTSTRNALLHGGVVLHHVFLKHGPSLGRLNLALEHNFATVFCFFYYGIFG